MDDRTDGRGHDEAVMPWQLAPVAVESEHHAPEPLEETLTETDFVVPWLMSPSDTRRVQLVPASSGEPGRVVRRRRLTFRRPQGGWG